MLSSKKLDSLSLFNSSLWNNSDNFSSRQFSYFQLYKGLSISSKQSENRSLRLLFKKKTIARSFSLFYSAFYQK